MGNSFAQKNTILLKINKSRIFSKFQISGNLKFFKLLNLYLCNKNTRKLSLYTKFNVFSLSLSVGMSRIHSFTIYPHVMKLW